MLMKLDSTQKQPTNDCRDWNPLRVIKAFTLINCANNWYIWSRELGVCCAGILQ